MSNKTATITGPKGGVFLLVECDEAAINFECCPLMPGHSSHAIKAYIPRRHKGFRTWVEFLPPGKWQLIGKASELTEGQAAEIVEAGQDFGVTKPFHLDYMDHAWTDFTAQDSLYTLCRSLSLATETTVILKSL